MSTSSTNMIMSMNSRVKENNNIDDHSHDISQQIEQFSNSVHESSESGSQISESSNSGSQSSSSGSTSSSNNSNMSASISIRNNNSSISSLTLIPTDSNTSSTDTSEQRSSTTPTTSKLLQQQQFTKFRTQVGKLLNKTTYQLFMIIIIIINALLLGIATFNFVENKPNVKQVFDCIDISFLVIYTIELCLIFIHLGMKKAFCNAWVDFDCIIIMSSWIIYQSKHVQILRSFRIIRCLKVISKFDSLKQVIHAFVRIIPKLKAFVLVLAFLFYISAIMFTQMFR